MIPSNYPIDKHKKVVYRSFKRIFKSNKAILNIAILLLITLSFISSIIFIIKMNEESLKTFLSINLVLVFFLFLSYIKTSKENKHSIYILEDRYFCFEEIIKEINIEILEKELSKAKEFIDMKLSEKSLSLKSLIPININTFASYILSITLAITSILASEKPDFSIILTLIRSTLFISNMYIYVILLTNLFYSSRRDRYAEMNYFLIRYKHENTY